MRDFHWLIIVKKEKLGSHSWRYDTALKKKASTHFFFLEGASLLGGRGIPGHLAAPYTNWGDGELEVKYASIPFQNKKVKDP